MQFVISKFKFKSIQSFFSRQLYQHRKDILIALFLAFLMGATCYSLAHKIPVPLINNIKNQDVWFGSDIPTVFANMTTFDVSFGRNNKHPLFPLIVFPIVYIIEKLFSLDSVSAVRVVMTATASLWVMLLFALLRLIGCYWLDAIFFSILGITSGAAIFWFTVPETFPFGSLSILLALIFVTLTQKYRFSQGWYVAVNVLTLSFTLTNWVIGLLTTIVNHRWKKVLRITIFAVGATILLWIIQRLIFKDSGFPFQLGTIAGERKFMSIPESNRLMAVIGSFFYQTIIMPAIQIGPGISRPGWPALDANVLNPASGGIWGTVAFVTWTALISLGFWGFFSVKHHLKLRVVLGLTLFAQLCLHFIYGVKETFIYSLHFLPLLIVLSAFSTFTRARLLAIILAGLLLVSAGINNGLKFNQVTEALFAAPGCVDSTLCTHQQTSHILWDGQDAHPTIN